MKTLLTICLATVMLLFAGYASASTIHWSDHRYSFYLDGQPLNKVIADLATREGIPTQIAPSLTNPVNAQFKDVKAAKMFQDLATLYNLQWYYDGYTLHVSRVQDAVTDTIQLQSLPTHLFKRYAKQVGAFDNRFYWGDAKGEGVVIVSGPRAYVNRLKDLARLFERHNRSYEVVYRWKTHGVPHYSNDPADAPDGAHVMRFAKSNPASNADAQVRMVESDPGTSEGPKVDMGRLWQPSQQ